MIRKSKTTKRVFVYPSLFKELEKYKTGGDLFDLDFLNKKKEKNNTEDVKIPYKIGYNPDRQYTQNLIEGILKQEAYSKYKAEDFYNLMDNISKVESNDSNIKQISDNESGIGPGRGYYQIEPESLKTNINRLKNYEKELGIKIGLNYDNINYNNFMENSKDVQRVIALAGILKEARENKTYIDPTDHMNTWLDYHWIGGKEREKNINDRISHWNKTLKLYTKD